MIIIGVDPENKDETIEEQEENAEVGGNDSKESSEYENAAMQELMKEKRQIMKMGMWKKPENNR